MANGSRGKPCTPASTSCVPLDSVFIMMVWRFSHVLPRWHHVDRPPQLWQFSFERPQKELGSASLPFRHELQKLSGFVAEKQQYPLWVLPSMAALPSPWGLDWVDSTARLPPDVRLERRDAESCKGSERAT